MATAFKNLSDFSSSEIPSASGYKFGILVSEWNSRITCELLNGTVDTLLKNGGSLDNITVHNVPGTYELSAGAKLMLETNKFDAIICLGCVIKGETPHFDFICQAVAQGLTNVSLAHSKPVIFGVITTNNMQQAIERSGGKHGNKGDEAAVTAIKMVDLAKKLKV